MSAAELNDALWAYTVKVAVAYAVITLVLGIANSFLAKHTDIGRDDTDPAGGRSDLVVLTDARTGCQYLSSARGGLTPRLDENGRHICNPEARK